MPDDPDSKEQAVQPILLTVRPHRISLYAGIASLLVIAVTLFVAIRLRTSDTGVIFRTSDAVSIILLGLAFAAGLMLVARPRLRVSADGLRVRNILGERYVPWALIRRIAFPEGAVWAQLDMADDELMPVMAIQAMDRSRAVEALRAAREIQAAHGPAAPTPSTLQYRTTDPLRPLGRLEKIDRIKLAQGKHPGRKAT